MYDFIDDSFCWGSFIIKHGVAFYISIEVVMNVYEFAFYNLGFNASHFDVRKDNDRVVAFHKNLVLKLLKKMLIIFILTFQNKNMKLQKKNIRNIYK
ncbi:hypothetical protein B10525_11260 [Campylobacter jejuni]|nr:hypothetical protein B10525_11260 [Campylobacter jejuni]